MGKKCCINESYMSGYPKDESPGYNFSGSEDRRALDSLLNKYLNLFLGQTKMDWIDHKFEFNNSGEY